MRHAAALFLAAIVGLLVPAVSARAEFIPWEYKWTHTPAVIQADAPGTSTIKLTDVSRQGSPPGTLIHAAGDTDMVATDISVVSTAPRSNPDTFSPTKYTLTLTILDDNSGQSGTLQFTGELYGTASALSAHIRNTFTGDQTQQLPLGNNLYTVTIGPFDKPGPPESDNPGAISASANVTVTTIQKTPEPSTLLLACVGLPFAGYGLWRRRRRQPAAAASPNLAISETVT
jgi:hypothetical protein